MSKKVLLNLDYALIQGAYWTFYVVAGVFVSVYMLGKGYSNTSIGMVIAVGNVLAVFMQSILANITDRVKKITDITVIKALVLILFILTGAALIIGIKSLFLTVLYTTLIIVFTSLHPFVNALSFTLEESGEHVSFGIGRSVGSFGCAVLGLAMGYLVEGFGVDVILVAGLIVLVFMEAVIIVTGKHYNKLCKACKSVPKTGENIKGLTKEPGENISFGKFISGNMVFMVMSVGVIGLFFSNVVFESFTIQIVENVGGDTSQMGITIFVMALLEMPMMICFDKLKKKFSYVFLIRVASVFFAAKIIMVFLAGSVTMVYIAQVNQIFGYGLMFPAMVGFIDDIMSKGEAVRGQAVFTVAITTGNVLGCVFGGRILDMFTVSTLLLVSSVIATAGAVIICLTINKIRRKNVERIL